MKILDWYIIRKFLGTFFFSMTLIISVSIVWDVTEKLDDFIQKSAPFKAIVFDYYLNFIPYFASLLAPLFTFIAVIYFTARMSANTEIIAILGSGVSFKRLLFPYLLAASVLASLSFYFQGWVIPHSNKVRLQFESTYIRNQYVYSGRNIHWQVAPGEYFYLESFNNLHNTGLRFSYEKMKEGVLFYKLTADQVSWDSTKSQWKLENYSVRNIQDSLEDLISGKRIDTALAITPKDFDRRIENIESMDNGELSLFIEQEKMRGADTVEFYLIEKYGRYSNPFSTFILTLIGVSLASRKVRGGTGMQIVFGLFLSFAYIFLMQISNTFATYGGLSPLAAVWIPNLFFVVIAMVLMKLAPK